MSRYCYNYFYRLLPFLICLMVLLLAFARGSAIPSDIEVNTYVLSQESKDIHLKFLFESPHRQ